MILTVAACRAPVAVRPVELRAAQDPGPGPVRVEVLPVSEPWAWIRCSEPDSTDPVGRGPAIGRGFPQLQVGRVLATPPAPALLPTVYPTTRLSRAELGSGWALDLGRGEAGYDDQPRPLGLDPLGLSGPPESLIQLLWSAPLGGGTSLVGRASATRRQDRPLEDLLEDPRISWVALGLEIRF